MGAMCAIYTAILPPSPDEIAALAKSNEGQIYGANRRTLGRRSWPPNTHSRSTSPRVPFHTPFFRPPVFRNRPS